LFYHYLYFYYFKKYFFIRLDSGDDSKISKEEFSSDAAKASIEKWVGPVEDFDAEFEKIDTNSGNSNDVLKSRLILSSAYCDHFNLL